MTAEDKLQAACVKWFRLQYPQHVLFAIPNGGNRNAITGAMLKKTGTLAGVADLFLMAPRCDPEFWSDRNDGYNGYWLAYCGLFIEMKVGKNGQTATQKDFQQKAEEAGYKYEICRSFDEFKTTIEKYLSY